MLGVNRSYKYTQGSWNVHSHKIWAGSDRLLIVKHQIGAQSSYPAIAKWQDPYKLCSDTLLIVYCASVRVPWTGFLQPLRKLWASNHMVRGTSLMASAQKAKERRWKLCRLNTWQIYMRETGCWHWAILSLRSRDMAVRWACSPSDSSDWMTLSQRPYYLISRNFQWEPHNLLWCSTTLLLHQCTVTASVVSVQSVIVLVIVLPD